MTDMSDVGNYFETVGGKIREQLGDNPCSETGFSAIAAAVLCEVPAPPIDVLAMADWATQHYPLPKQVNFTSSFGQPPLVVYETPGFYLEVLFWFPSRTGIHGHGFTGAFRVLDGYSLQIEYQFTEASASEQGFRLGTTTPRHIEWIAPGKICPIPGQDDFIHCVAHMGNPSLTLVARTYGQERSHGLTQFTYFRCGIAYRSGLHRQSVARLAEVLGAVQQGRPAEFTGRVLACLRQADPVTFYRLLEALLKQLPLPVFTQQVWLPVRTELGATQPRSVAALEETIRERTLWPLIRSLADPRQQLLLALSELLPDEPEREALICRSHGVTQSSLLIDAWSKTATPH